MLNNNLTSLVFAIPPIKLPILLRFKTNEAAGITAGADGIQQQS
jgi:hypothetical protein